MYPHEKWENYNGFSHRMNVCIVIIVSISGKIMIINEIKWLITMLHGAAVATAMGNFPLARNWFCRSLATGCKKRVVFFF
jgi:hypothetical protein